LGESDKTRAKGVGSPLPIHAPFAGISLQKSSGLSFPTGAVSPSSDNFGGVGGEQRQPAFTWLIPSTSPHKIQEAGAAWPKLLTLMVVRIRLIEL
jgi:hypothetical protein